MDVPDTSVSHLRVDDVFAKCLVVHLRSLRYKKSIGSEKNWPIKMARRGKSVEDGFPFSLFRFFTARFMRARD